MQPEPTSHPMQGGHTNAPAGLQAPAAHVPFVQFASSSHAVPSATGMPPHEVPLQMSFTVHGLWSSHGVPGVGVQTDGSPLHVWQGSTRQLALQPSLAA